MCLRRSLLSWFCCAVLLHPVLANEELSARENATASNRTSRNFDFPEAPRAVKGGKKYYSLYPEEYRNDANDDDVVSTTSSPPNLPPKGFHDFVPGNADGGLVPTNVWSPYAPKYYPKATNWYKGGVDPKWYASDDSSDGGLSFGKYKNFPWKGDSWTPEQMMNTMMMMNAMKNLASAGGNHDDSDDDDDVKGNAPSIFGGFDPKFLLVAAILPIGLLLTAILPVFFKMAMQGQGIPTVTTTATGNRSRSLGDDDLSLMLNPVLEAINNFSKKSSQFPRCVQRNFCQAIKGDDTKDRNDATFLLKSLRKASAFMNEQWLEAIGIKSLMQAISRGKCESIPCADSSKTENS